MLLACLFAGCAKREFTLTPAMLENAPTASQIIDAHNQRIAMLASSYSQGVVVIRWNDDRGRHTEQGDLEFWRSTGDRTALRISKLGEVGLWLGSDSTQWWLFNLLDKQQRTLIRGMHERLADDRFDEVGAVGAVGVSPLALLDLLGLTELQLSDAAAAARQLTASDFDGERRAWVMPARGRSGLLRIGFDRVTLLPTLIETLDAAGAVLASSELSRWESVQVEGVAIMARPRMPLTIDIRRMDAATGESSGEVRIALNQNASTFDDRMAQRIFDLDRLIAAMRPDVVEVAGGR